jgi:hypothetical protein
MRNESITRRNSFLSFADLQFFGSATLLRQSFRNALLEGSRKLKLPPEIPVSKKFVPPQRKAVRSNSLYNCELPPEFRERNSSLPEVEVEVSSICGRHD